MKNIFLKLLFFVFCSISIISHAQTPPIVYVAKDGTGDFNCSPDSTISNNQNEINEALNFIADNPEYTTLYLKGATYIIDEPVLISANTIITGDETAIIQLKNNVGWWTQDKPMIAQTNRHILYGYDGDGMGDNEWNPYGHEDDEISNIEIYGFIIDGGLQQEPSGNRYNTLLHFTFPNNVMIHDMKFRNGESDAIRLSSLGSFVINSEIYNNEIVACGHDGISFVGVLGCHAHHNKIIKTRTNSGLRATDCNNIHFHHNIVGNSISFPPSGYAGIQIQNNVAEFPCTNADIHDNVIYGKCEGIHLGEETNTTTYPTGTMRDVHIHHNRIYKTNTISSEGDEVVLTGGIVVMGYQNTIIEHNIIDGSISDGIVYRGNTGGGTGYQTIVRNNIIINNVGYGINNKSPDINTFISNNNLLFDNGIGNFNNMVSTDDLYNSPLFGISHSPLNQWHHIVANYDNTTETMRIFIDGVEKSHKSLAGIFGTIGSNDYNLLLGAIYNGNLWYEGRQDEFAIWNRALSATEVTGLYNNGLPSSITGDLTSGLQAYLKMENDWNDSSGNGFDAIGFSASFTTEAIEGSFAGEFNGVNDQVVYPTDLSTESGLTLSVWVYRTGLEEEFQTIINKGRMDDFNHVWLYFRGESVVFEIGNGSDRFDLEAYITNPEDIDYHLKSAYGRWNGTEWIHDDQTSLCINAGFGLSDYSNEPLPNGNRVNIGAFGNTVEASKSPFASSISEIKKTEIYLYPNPTRSKVFINKKIYLGKKFQIISVLGKTIEKGIISTNSIDLSRLSNGIYFIKIEDFLIENNKIVIK